MAVSTTDTYSGPYTANGITTDFPFTFKAADEAEVGVLLRVGGTDSIVSTGFSVDLTDSGGTVSFDDAPEDGEVYVYSEPAFTQEIAFANGQPFLPTVVIRANDRSERSEEQKSELKSLMRISYAVFRLKKKKN